MSWDYHTNTRKNYSKLHISKCQEVNVTRKVSDKSNKGNIETYIVATLILPRYDTKPCHVQDWLTN